MRRILVLLVSGLVLGACSHLKLNRPVRTGSGDWPTYGRDNSRSNHTPESLKPPLTNVWSSDVTGGVGKGSPVVIDSLVIVGTLRGELYVLDARTGDRKGWIGMCEEISGSPVTSGNIVYVAGAGNGESLIAFDLSAGKAVWKMSYGDFEASPMMAGNRLYLGNLNGVFLCVDAASGEKVWSFQTPDNLRLKGIRSTGAMEGKTVVFGSEDGSVYALDAETGKIRWTHAAGAPVVAPLVASEGRAFVGTLSGEFLALDMETGSVQWKRSCGSPVHAGAALSQREIVVGTTGGLLLAFDRQNGEELWRADLGSVINAAPVVAGEHVYVGTLGNAFFGVRLSTGEVIFRQQLEGRVKTPPAVAYGMLIIATDDRMVHAFRPEEVR